MNKINLRKSHPFLFRCHVLASCLNILFATNFWRYTPTFIPFNLNKNIIGGMFVTIGLLQVLFLVLVHNLQRVRLLLTASFIWNALWGVTNTKQFFDGNASLQLPIAFVGLAIFQFLMLLESPVNPFTERK